MPTFLGTVAKLDVHHMCLCQHRTPAECSSYCLLAVTEWFADILASYRQHSEKHQEENAYRERAHARQESGWQQAGEK